MVVAVVAVVASTLNGSAALAAAAPGSCSIVTPSSQFVGQVEGEDAQIWRLYQAYFLRQPDVPGFDYWVTTKLNGASLADISYVFANGSEFAARYGNLSNSQFVDLVYQNVLCRAAEPAGHAYWLNLLDTGELTRSGMMMYFSEGREFLNRTETCYSVDLGESAAANGCLGPEVGEIMELLAIPRNTGLAFRSAPSLSAPIVYQREAFFGPHVISQGHGALADDVIWWHVSIGGVDAWADSSFLGVAGEKIPYDGGPAIGETAASGEALALSNLYGGNPDTIVQNQELVYLEEGTGVGVVITDTISIYSLNGGNGPHSYRWRIFYDINDEGVVLTAMDYERFCTVVTEVGTNPYFNSNPLCRP